MIVTDVYAATSNISSFLARGASQLLIVNSDSVTAVKNEYREALVIGESPNLPEDFFDAPNDPHGNTAIDVSGKLVI